MSKKTHDPQALPLATRKMALGKCIEIITMQMAFHVIGAKQAVEQLEMAFESCGLRMSEALHDYCDAVQRDKKPRLDLSFDEMIKPEHEENNVVQLYFF